VHQRKKLRQRAERHSETAVRAKFCKNWRRRVPGVDFGNCRQMAGALNGLLVRARIGGAFLLAVMAAACSTTLEETTGSLYVAPGKFVLLKCPDIAARSIADSKREKELVSLMDRANQDPTGPVVNTLIYSTDLNTVRADLAELRRTAAEKNCNNEVTAAPQPTASQPLLNSNSSR
jgi:hypothetical protein